MIKPRNPIRTTHNNLLPKFDSIIRLESIMKWFEDKLDKLIEMIILHIAEKDPKLTKTDYKPLQSNLEHK